MEEDGWPVRPNWRLLSIDKKTYSVKTALNVCDTEAVFDPLDGWILILILELAWFPKGAGEEESSSCYRLSYKSLEVDAVLIASFACPAMHFFMDLVSWVDRQYKLPGQFASGLRQRCREIAQPLVNISLTFRSSEWALDNSGNS